MAADFSVGGIGSSRGFDFKPKPNDASTQSDQAPLHKTSTIRELKSAEHNGEILSISDEQLVKAVEKAIKALEGPYTSFDISVHDETKQLIVKVMNKETGEVIREIPNEKTLDMVAKMMEVAGILIDERR
ncbi:flagellar protein FlaG [Gorillibacterium sp. sgz5001074]|uniref:flagellar protein FlaG n=1 Tax=Gorillibacterium sp. sgz5001074 TaxID=3446695 RepID=UPI003F664153